MYKAIVLGDTVLWINTKNVVATYKVREDFIKALDYYIYRYELPRRSKIMRSINEELVKILNDIEDVVKNIDNIVICVEYTAKNNRSYRICRKVVSK